MTDKRIEYLDYLRVLSCLMVILVHACEFFYVGADAPAIANDTDRWVVGIIDSALRPCVPLFVMISGYLLLPVTMPAATFIKKRMTRVVVPFIIWSVLYATLPLLWAEIDLDGSLGRLGHLLINFNDASGHLWFVYMLIGVYLVMPIISPWLERANRREELAVLAVWAFTMFFPYMRDYMGPVYGECFWNEFHMFYYFSGHVGYVVLAHYLRRWVDLTPARALAISLPLIVVGYVITAGVFMDRSYYATSMAQLEVSWRFCTPNVAMMALGMFLLARFIKAGRCYNLIRALSIDSYGIYLMHIFFLSMWFKIFQGTMHTLAIVLVIGPLTFVTCAIVTRMIRLVPGGKYIAG